MRKITYIAFMTVFMFAAFGASQLQFQSPLKRLVYQDTVSEPVALPQFALDDQIDAREAAKDQFFSQLAEAE